MAVIQLTTSATISGVQIVNVLNGDDHPLGYDFGDSIAGSDPDIKNLYIRHDGALEIIELKVYLKEFNSAYGGEYRADWDLVKAIQQGDSGFGIQIDFDAKSSPSFSSFTTIKDSLADTIMSAIKIPSSAMLKKDGNRPSVPVSGKIGPENNTVLGDRVYLKLRWAVPVGENAPGIRQVTLAFTYEFTT